MINEACTPVMINEDESFKPLEKAKSPKRSMPAAAIPTKIKIINPLVVKIIFWPLNFINIKTIKFTVNATLLTTIAPKAALILVEPNF